MCLDFKTNKLLKLFYFLTSVYACIVEDNIAVTGTINKCFVVQHIPTFYSISNIKNVTQICCQLLKLGATEIWLLICKILVWKLFVTILRH